MRYFLDTEFWERPCQIDLISVGIVAEDGREYYAENKEIEGLVISNDWLTRNVIPRLSGPRKCRGEIASDIISFVGNDNPEFWAYYGAYDWVAFCFLFGNMTDLPKSWPMYYNEIKQLQSTLGVLWLPEQTGTEHLAIADARWNKVAYDSLMSRLVRQEQGVIRKIMGVN